MDSPLRSMSWSSSSEREVSLLSIQVELWDQVRELWRLRLGCLLFRKRPAAQDPVLFSFQQSTEPTISGSPAYLLVAAPAVDVAISCTREQSAMATTNSEADRLISSAVPPAAASGQVSKRR